MSIEFSNAEAKAKISALMGEYSLGFTQNAGGGCFRNADRSISIQVSNWYDDETLEELLTGLRKLGFDPVSQDEPLPISHNQPVNIDMAHIINQDNHGRTVLHSAEDKAAHSYVLTLPTKQAWQQNGATTIKFQSGPVAKVGVNGFTTENILSILRHRLITINEASPCDENVQVQELVKEALKILKQRDDRLAAEKNKKPMR